MSYSRAKALGGLLVLLLIGLAVYYPALHRSFVYDDILTVRDNDFIARPGNLLHLWGMEYLRGAGEQSYRPVLTGSYIIDCAIWGKAPFGFSLTNLLIHIAGAWLLGLLLWLWFPHRGLFAGAAALLYLLAAAISETVISPGHREQVLSVLLMLAGAHAWTQARAGRAWVRPAAPILFFVACMTLEWSVLAPFALLAWAWASGDDRRQALRATWPELAAVGLFLALYAFALPREDVDVKWIGGGHLGGLWNFGPLVARYVRIALLPLNLRPYYTFQPTPVRWAAVANVALWAVVLAAGWALYKRRAWGLGPLLFVAALLPMGHVTGPFWIPLAERYLALPLLGGIPLLAAALTANKRRLAIAPAVVIFFAWAALARGHAMDWRDGIYLWGKAVALEPDDPVSWTNYAASLAAHGEREPAIEAHRRAWAAATRAGEENAQQPMNVAQALAAAGRPAEACDLLAEQAPRFRLEREWLLDLGRLCAGRRQKMAVDALAQVVSRNLNDGEAWADFCAVDPSRAQSCVREALQHCPDDGRLWLHVAAINEALGDAAKAAQAVGVALRSPQGESLRDPALALLQRLKARERGAAP
jgi:tetratricopeptide (TPR) repeat protein